MFEIIKNAVEKHRQLILDTERYIWQNPETGYKEVKTSKYMAGVFEKLGYDFVSAGYFRGNARSARVLEKCGFQYLFDYDLKLTEEKTVSVATFIRYKEK